MTSIIINNMELDLTIIGIVGIIGFFGLVITKIVTTHQGSGSKYLKNKIKEMEEYTLYQKKLIQTYKNKASNMERPPQIEGELGELATLAPDIIGLFGDSVPKWAQGLMKDPEIMQYVLKQVEAHPEKAKEWFGKLVGKKQKGGESGQEAPTLTI